MGGKWGARWPAREAQAHGKVIEVHLVLEFDQDSDQQAREPDIAARAY